MNLKIAASIALACSFALVGMACGGGGGGTTTGNTSNSPGNSTSTPGSFGQMAQSGQSVYSSNCARCHGASGQGGIGPQLVGNANTHLAYPTAAVLYTKISTTMPQDQAGKLSTTQYQQVLCYLLVQNNWVTSGNVFDASALAQIALK